MEPCPPTLWKYWSWRTLASLPTLKTFRIYNIYNMHCIKENTWEQQKMRLGQPFAIFTSKVSTPYPTASSGLPFANFACCPAVLRSPFASRWECSHPVHEGDRERPHTSKTGKATRKLPGCSPTQTTGQNRSWRVERIQAGWKVFVFGCFWDVSPKSKYLCGETNPHGAAFLSFLYCWQPGTLWDRKRLDNNG